MNKFEQIVDSSRKNFSINQVYFFLLPGKHDSLRIHLIKGSLGSFVLKIASTGLALFINIFLARILGVSDFGCYSYALTIILIFSIPTKDGLPNLLIRQIAAYKSQAKWGLMRGLLIRAVQAVLFISMVIGAILFFVAWNYSDKIPSLSLPVFCIALCIFPFLGIESLCASTLRGLNHVLLSQLPYQLFRQGIFILFLVIYIYIFNTNQVDPSIAMWFHLISIFIAFLFGVLWVYKYLPTQAKMIAAKFDTQNWVNSLLPFLVVSGMNIVNKRIDIVMLGIFTNSEAVGVYKIVVDGAELILFSLMAVNMAVAPIFSKLYIGNEMEKMQRIVTISSLAILSFSLPAALVLIIFGPWILSNIFGAEFVKGATALTILSIGQLINAGIGSVAFLLNMTGNEKDSAKGVTIAAIINIILNLMLVPNWGISGAAVATALSLISWNLILAVYVYKKLNIYPSVVGIFKGLI